MGKFYITVHSAEGAYQMKYPKIVNLLQYLPDEMIKPAVADATSGEMTEDEFVAKWEAYKVVPDLSISGVLVDALQYVIDAVNYVFSFIS